MAEAVPLDFWEIGDWKVDPWDATISRNGEATKLEPRTMRLLVCLAEAQGHIEEALRWNAAALTYSADNTDLYAERGSWQLAAGRPAQARDTYREATRTVTGDARFGLASGTRLPEVQINGAPLRAGQTLSADQVLQSLRNAALQLPAAKPVQSGIRNPGAVLL